MIFQNELSINEIAKDPICLCIEALCKLPLVLWFMLLTCNQEVGGSSLSSVNVPYRQGILATIDSSDPDVVPGILVK